MLQRIRQLNSENHLGEEIGDFNPIIRADFEDAMVQALEDCYQDGRLTAFRAFLRKHRGRWPPDYYDLLQAQDSWAQYAVYYLTCTLRRMAPRYEHAANKLMHNYGMDPQQIPQGTEVIQF